MLVIGYFLPLFSVFPFIHPCFVFFFTSTGCFLLLSTLTCTPTLLFTVKIE